MQLDDYIQQVQEQLAASAALGDERTQQIAGALAAAATPSVRLAIMAALGACADEITGALLDSPGAPRVTVRLDGEQVQVTVTGGTPTEAPPRTDDGDASARISLRLSESLKADVEQAAASDGVSVNTWLVRAASNALAPRSTSPGGKRTSHRVTGWING